MYCWVFYKHISRTRPFCGCYTKLLGVSTQPMAHLGGIPSTGHLPRSTIGHPGSNAGLLGNTVGLPLGNLTSQLLVNIYMNEFDQFVKHNLKVKHYIRSEERR